MFIKDENTRIWNYSKQPEDIIVGILFGHFCPFTGPKGHGRMLDALKKIGAEKFVIGLTDGGEKLDAGRYMFNTNQRKEISEMALKEMGLEGVVGLTQNRGGPEVAFGRLATLASRTFGQNIRVVFCFGPDREESFKNFFVPFGEQLDNPKYEVVILKDRGSGETSGTLVREFIKKSDIPAIQELTGYSEEVCSFLINTWQKNAKILDKFNSVNLNAMDGKHHLEHLFNDNKASQMKATSFLKILKYLHQTGDSFNETNYEVSEKIDGSSSFVGFDGFGFYFSKFGVSIKMRKTEDVGYKYRDFFELLKQSGVSKVLSDWREKIGCEDIKVQLENVIPGASRDNDSVQAVLIKYDKSKIGAGLVVTVQAIADIIPIEDPSIKEQVCDCLKSVGLQAVSSTTLPTKEVDCSDIIEAALPVFDNPKLAKKVGLSDLQQVLQERILSIYDKGNFGPDYEGLVFTSKADGSQFKVTSEVFKDLMYQHNVLKKR